MQFASVTHESNGTIAWCISYEKAVTIATQLGWLTSYTLLESTALCVATICICVDVLHFDGCVWVASQLCEAEDSCGDSATSTALALLADMPKTITRAVLTWCSLVLATLAGNVVSMESQLSSDRSREPSANMPAFKVSHRVLGLYSRR